MRSIDLFAKKILEAAVKVGTPKNLNGISESVEKPEFATAVGLALLAAEENAIQTQANKKPAKKSKSDSKAGFIKKLFNKFWLHKTLDLGME